MTLAKRSLIIAAVAIISTMVLSVDDSEAGKKRRRRFANKNKVYRKYYKPYYKPVYKPYIAYPCHCYQLYCFGPVVLGPPPVTAVPPNALAAPGAVDGLGAAAAAPGDIAPPLDQAAPPQAEVAPPQAQIAPPPGLIAPFAGSWIAKPAHGISIHITLHPDGSLAWNETVKGKTFGFVGKGVFENGVMSIVRVADGKTLVGTLALLPGNRMNFRLLNGGLTDPGLTFLR
jgi:hypothetical protein